MDLRNRSRGAGVVCASIVIASVLFALPATAATIQVPAGGDLQAALDVARGGDVIMLAPGASYVGNFILRRKDGVTTPIILRTGTSDADLPPPGVRMTPAYAPRLAKIKSPNSVSALRTATAAHHWTIMLIEFQANYKGYGEIIALGAGDSTQTSLSQVPYALRLDRVYVHGDPLVGQKRGIGLNSRDTAIVNSWVSDCKVIGQDSQAISGYNGPGNYLIENNYLEGAAENFMLGGADPTIPELVTTNVVFRWNHLRKPLEWREPILDGVTNLTARAVARGGSLPAGIYTYEVVARRPASQGAQANSAVSNEVSVLLTSSGGVTLSWSPVEGAVDYVVFGRTAGAPNMYWKTTSPLFTDAGIAGTAGAPGKASKWAVKNIFELKNAQDVLIEGNVFENLWVADQPGYPIVFTPRNQDGRAPWAVVQNVTFRDNIVRHTAGGVNILGHDDVHPSRQTKQITVANNLFDDMTSATWGSARFVLVGAGADTVKIDHNTAIGTNSAAVWMYGAPNTNVRYTNNMSRHGSYGFMCSGYAYGNASIAECLPGSIVTSNVLAGGPASRYPAGNLFPTVTAWQDEFIGYASGDYRLKPSSSLCYLGTEGKPVGADLDRINPHAAIALGGDSRVYTGTRRVQVTTTAERDSHGDFDGDRHADLVVFRPSTGMWYVRRSADGTQADVQWGNGNDRPVRGDFDGDGLADIAVFRPWTGTWYIQYSGSGVAGFQWGNGNDTPVPADYDGDGRTDIAVFRPSDGFWYVRYANTGQTAAFQWGNGYDWPVPGDYDGDGKADLAVFRPSNGVWYVWYSASNTTAGFQWGDGYDIPVPGDYDGDGRTDIAVFRPSNGTWYFRYSGTGATAGFQWGNGNDLPVPGDYDGDGRTDAAVFRPSNATWYFWYSATGSTAGVQWGSATDIPILKRP